MAIHIFQARPLVWGSDDGMQDIFPLDFKEQEIFSDVRTLEGELQKYFHIFTPGALTDVLSTKSSSILHIAMGEKFHVTN